MQPVFSLFPKTGTRLRSLHEEVAPIIALPSLPLVKPQMYKKLAVGRLIVRRELFARPPKSRLKLVLLRVLLRAEFAFFRLAVEVGARTVVQGRSFVLPDGYTGISFVGWCRWRHRQSQAHQRFFEQAQRRRRRIPPST